MSQPVDFDPNTMPLEDLEQYLMNTDPQQDDAAVSTPEPEDVETDYVDLKVNDQSAEPAPAEPVQAEQPVTYSHKEHKAALNRRAKEVRESIQGSDEYLLAKELVTRRAAADKVSRKEAAKRLREEMFAQEAERLSKDPKALAEAVLRSQMPQEPAVEETPAPAAQNSVEDRARALASAVRDSMQNGRLPSDFSIEKCLEINPAFFEDAQTYGEAAAVRIAEERFSALAAQQATRRIEAQQALPRSIAPSSQPAPVPRGIEDMSDAEFRRLEQQVDRYTNAGIHVRI